MLKRSEYRSRTARQICRLVVFVLCCSALQLRAQPEFDQRLTLDQIQHLLNEGIFQPDLRKQALAWYQWAYYDETQTGISDSAFQYLAKSVDRFGKAGDSLGYHRANMDLADRLADNGLLEEAQRKQQAALGYFQRSQNLYLETHVLARLNRIYLAEGDSVRALLSRRAFLDKNKILKDTVLEFKVLMDEAYQSFQKKKYSNARYTASRALRLAEQCNYTFLANRARVAIGHFCLMEQDYKTAIYFLKKAEAQASRVDEPQRQEIYHYLSRAYAALDSLPPAYEYALHYAELGDTLRNRDKATTLQRLALQFDTRQKRVEIETLEREKRDVEARSQGHRLTAAALAVALCAVLLAMFFIVRDYRHRLHTDSVIAHQNEELNKRIIRELEDSLQIETMRSMLAGQEGERRRVAQDLHDSVGGMLAATRIQVESLLAKNAHLADNADLIKVKNLLDDTVSETRNIARNMQPGALMEFGLTKAVQDVTGRIYGESAPNITFEHFGDTRDLDQTVALNSYRIIQELIQNSLKYAKSKEILVQITRTEGQLALLVEDDGIGFDPLTVRKGMGTDNIANRIQFLRGELNVQTAPGKGTSTLVTIPLEYQGKP
jgi:signal transduction histidine kinase